MATLYKYKLGDMVKWTYNDAIGTIIKYDKLETTPAYLIRFDNGSECGIPEWALILISPQAIEDGEITRA